MRPSVSVASGNPQAMFGLATALEEVGTDAADEEADALNLRFIQEHPTSPMVEAAEKARTAFVQKLLKYRAVRGSRPDVMMCISTWRAGSFRCPKR